MITTIHGFSSEKILAVYQKYNAHSHYVSISDTNRHPSLNYLATVFNGLNLDEFEFNEIPDDYLLFFGRIHPDKGTAEAIDIAQRANKKLIIAGIIQDQRYFDESVKPHLNDKITFIEAAEPALRNQLMGKALALLHPINFEEPFGLSVVESMLCGTPVIAFNKGSMPEIIKNGENGFLVTHVDEAIEAIQNIQKVNRKTCCDLANHKFSAKKMTDKYIMLYYKILCQN
jgi:glycosyltransferase involved in cell wall biosynthesis